MKRSHGVLLAATLCLLLLAVPIAVFFYRYRATPQPAEDQFKKLGVEKAEKKIMAPDFTLEDLSGRRVSLKGLKGKVVFLNFWATWCIPCRQEMPAMEKLHREFRDKGLEVVAVNFRESGKEVWKFFDELGLTFTALLDEDGEVSLAYGVWSLPMSYFINQKGEFVGKAIGIREWDGEPGKAFFRGLLNESPGETGKR